MQDSARGTRILKVNHAGENGAVHIYAGQMAMALVLDHFGWAGYREAPISPGKVAGLLLVVAGIWLIQRS